VSKVPLTGLLEPDDGAGEVDEGEVTAGIRVEAREHPPAVLEFTDEALYQVALLILVNGTSLRLWWQMLPSYLLRRWSAHGRAFCEELTMVRCLIDYRVNRITGRT
jgi:hypothetical protein